MDNNLKRHENDDSSGSISNKSKTNDEDDYYDHDTAVKKRKINYDNYEEILNLTWDYDDDVMSDIASNNNIQDENFETEEEEEEQTPIIKEYLRKINIKKRETCQERNKCMAILGNDLMERNKNIPTINLDFIGNYFPEIDKLLNQENEYILRNFFSHKKEIDDKREIVEESVKEPPLYELLQSCSSIPQTISNLEIVDNELLKKAKKKQAILEKERKKKEIDEEKINLKKKELTWPKLMIIENSLENEVETRLRREVLEIEDMSSLGGDTVFDCDEDLGLSQEEIDTILKQCASNNIFELQIDDSTHGCPTVFSDVSNSQSTATKAVYDCHICGELSSNQFSEFYAHIKQHHDNWKISMQHRETCVICGFIVPSTDLKSHMLKHIDHCRCSICHQFVATADIAVHKTEHCQHFQCDICGELYKTKVAIRKHMSHHKKGKEYSCENCQMRFAGFEKMIRHNSEKHMSIDPVYGECPYCMELTTAVKNHLHSVYTCKFKCRVCSKVEKSSMEFMKHMEVHEIGSERRSVTIKPYRKFYDCEDCKMRLFNNATFQAHKRFHSIDNLYTKPLQKAERAYCDVCGTTMLHSHFNLHMDKHKIFERCFKCFKFVPKNSFKDHMSSHEFDLQCEICGEVFIDQDKMINHRWFHGRTDNRPCSDCTLIFISELQRAKHISLIHKKIDPEFVECYFCKELIGDKIDRHLSDIDFCLRRCKLCKTRFKYFQDFEHHVKTHQ